MGIKERQERDREAVRRSILDAARELFVSEGYQNVSIRKIAERIEYSPAAIYSYFPSKDDIFFALAEEGFRLLAQLGMSACERSEDPIERYRVSARTSSASSFSRRRPQRRKPTSGRASRAAGFRSGSTRPRRCTSCGSACLAPQRSGWPSGWRP